MKQHQNDGHKNGISVSETDAAVKFGMGDCKSSYRNNNS